MNNNLIKILIKVHTLNLLKQNSQTTLFNIMSGKGFQIKPSYEALLI